MLKVFAYDMRYGTLFLELNEKFQIVDKPEDADIIAAALNIGKDEDWVIIKNMIKPHHVFVLFQIFHIDHFMDMNYTQDNIKKLRSVLPTKKIIIVHTDINQIDRHNAIYYDHMFDRQKLYCTDYDKGISLPGRVWTYGCSKELYSINPIEKKLFKKFLAPMRIYHWNSTVSPRMMYRKKIKQFLSKQKDSYITDNNTSAAFLPNAVDETVLINITGERGGIWYPISDIYYNTSLINVYTETLVLTSDGVRLITEKTYDPLIKGNFILPFGYSGLIQDILGYGFKLPTWIDYSYDKIVDDDDRFTAYMESLYKLSECTTKKLFHQAMNDWDILEHNRLVFYSRPYSYPLLADKIKLCIDHNDSNDWKY